MSDQDLEGGQSISEDQVQRFLSQNGSYLASYKIRGQSAASIIVSAGQDHKINPVYLLARIQGESSLISSGSKRGLSTATGCGCPDGRGCSQSEAGFKGQVECTATLMRDYLDELDRGGKTRAGWAVGKPSHTLDPCTVTPANRATAAIYTYTPWVGKNSSGCGSSRSGGATLLVKIFDKYKGNFGVNDSESTNPDPPADEPQAPSGSTPTGTPQQGDGKACASPTLQSTSGRDSAPSGACVQSESNSVWYQCQDGEWVRGVDEDAQTGPAGACTEWDALQ